MDELRHRVDHDIFVQHLNEHGCLFGQKELTAIRTALDVVNKRYASKFESAEAAAFACTQLVNKIKDEYHEVKSLTRDAITCTHAASAAVDKAIDENKAFTNNLIDKFEAFKTDITREFRGMWIKSIGPAAFLAAVITILKAFKIL
jgi:hypothetical protein